jgi:hypothetical protein
LKLLAAAIALGTEPISAGIAVSQRTAAEQQVSSDAHCDVSIGCCTQCCALPEEATARNAERRGGGGRRRIGSCLTHRWTAQHKKDDA